LRTESHDGLLRFSAISQLGYIADDLLFPYSLSSAAVIPPENPNVWTAFALYLEETSVLKSAHTISFCIESVANHPSAWIERYELAIKADIGEA
jgi:hypothetical protein